MEHNTYLISNEEAILVAAYGDEGATSIIRTRFRNFIKKTCGTIFHQNAELLLDFDDLYLAGEAALHHAIGSYELGPIPFAAYAKVVINRGINTYVRSQSGPTIMLFKRALSLESFVNDNDDSLMLCDIIGSDDLYTLKKFDSVMLEHFDEIVPITFTSVELALVKLRLEGYSFGEISKIQKLSRRKLDAIVSQIRHKADLNLN